MKSWKQSAKQAAIIGSLASVASAAPLLIASRRENGTYWGGINAPSQWLWGRRALYQDRRSWRYTACGALIHHFSACFWGVFHSWRLGRRAPSVAPLRLLRAATTTTVVAAVVDLVVVPGRLSPGFQWRLTRPSLVLVYVLFGAGVALGSYVVNRQRR